MKGTIQVIKTDNYTGKRRYGFISSREAGRDDIYFNKSDLTNCQIDQLQEGDDVEFDLVPQKDGKLRANNVRLEAGDNTDERSEDMETHVTPGLNIAAKQALQEITANSDVVAIIKQLSHIFYITRVASIKVGNSDYHYCLAKPTDYYRDVFHLYREIIVILSDYVSYEPRDNDAYESVHRRIGAETRLEKAMHLLVHHDSKVGEKMTEYLNDNTHKQIIIPFTFQEILDPAFHETLVQERFKKWLFDVDMFADVDPITNEVFFFGRRDFINDIAKKCKNGSNSGVFGLRRSGKTSVLFAVQRQLEAMGTPEYQYVLISCGSLLKLNWKKALYYVMQRIYEKVCEAPLQTPESDYDANSTAIVFERDLGSVLNKLKRPLTLMFDEIENITNFTVKNEENQFDEDDYISFWNIIKTCYIKYQKRLSLLIAGTNPMINEAATIREAQNPMYATLASTNQGTYLQPFSFDEIKNMVNTLGAYMGLRFNNDVISKLREDCGGHPYLIRMTCSYINRYCKQQAIQRPALISKAIYDKAIPEFECSPEAEKFFEMILRILISDYPTEYNTLKLLATEGDRIIAQTKTDQEINHLIGYGLVESNQKNLCIRYNTVDRFLKGTYRFERAGLSVKEQADEIDFRLGDAEISLRKLIRQTLRISMGPVKAKDAVIDAMRNHRTCTAAMIDTAKKLDYDKELFDPSLNKGLFFLVLAIIIKDHMDIFQNTFNGESSDVIQHHMTVLNKSRRCPAHNFEKETEDWSDKDFQDFRISISWLEEILKVYD